MPLHYLYSFGRGVFPVNLSLRGKLSFYWKNLVYQRLFALIPPLKDVGSLAHFVKEIMDRKSYIILAIILIAFLLRFAGKDRLFFGDETDWARTVDTITKGTNNFILNVQPPMTALIYSFFSTFFKNLRIIPLFFGMLTILLTYYIAVKLDGKVALLSLIFISFSYYHVLASQLIDMDGGILTFIIFLTYYLLVSENYELSAIFFLFALLTRPTSLIFVLPVGYYLFKSGKIRKITPYIIVLILFVPIWLLIDKLTFQTFSETLNHYMNYSTLDIKELLAYKFLNGARIITRITPPVLFGLIISAYLMRKEKNKILGLLSFHILLAFLFFLVTHTGDQVRYFSIAIPAISIVISNFASKGMKLVKTWEFLLLSLIYLLILVAIDFNEVNLLLLLPLLLVTAIPLVFYRNLNKLMAIFFVLSIVFSLFMLSGTRTYDELRSYAVNDILVRLRELCIGKIILLQEKGVAYYFKGDSKFLTSIDEFNKTVEKGNYVVNEPMMPAEFPDYLKGYFWRVGLREILEGKCSLVYEKELHGIVVDEIYKC